MTTKREDLGRIIWETSRGDENSVSATGANIIADAILAAGYEKPVPPARESPEWAALCQTAENLGRALAEFQNAKDDYVAIYPKDKQ